MKKLLGNRRIVKTGSVFALVAALTLTGCGSEGQDQAGTSGNGNGVLSRGVTIDAPSGPGSGYDQTAREVEKTLKGEGITNRVEVRNTQGAGGTVALSQFVGKSEANELMIGGLSLVGATVTNSAPDKLSDLTPVARLIGEYEVIVVPAESPYKDLEDFLTALKKEPGKNPIAIGNQGGVDHMWGATLVKEAGTDPKDVNFVTFSGGGEALVALLGNKVAAGIAGYGEFGDQVEAGKLRVLAVSSEKPIEVAPDAPTIADAGYPDAVLVNWRGIFAPPGISEEDRTELTESFSSLTQSEAWKEVLTSKGWSDEFLPGEEFAKELQNQQSDVESLLTELGLA